MKQRLPSIYWYDFETFGVDPRRDRASQFAGLRTDEELNIIGEPLVMYCRPANDFLPSPVSCLITGITPQVALDQGLDEAEFSRRLLAEFATPQTCVTGYNSLRFDDEVTRQLLYRNFQDPYEREWKNGCSRWDIIDMLRLCAATRPAGINWPRREDGNISFRLEELTVANGIEHAQAHDAQSDVLATIAMARLVRDKQPKLYDYVYRMRGKRQVMAEIDLQTRKPFLHISGMYPARHGNLALVMPLGVHPRNNNGVLVYDLRQDPAQWMGLSAEEIRERVFTASAELEEGVERIGLKTLHTNRCPVLASPAVLEPDLAQQYGIDLEAARRHWETLNNDPQVLRKLLEVFNQEPETRETDPDFMIYSGGFFSDSDRSLMQTVRATSPEDLARLDLPFRDPRLPEMLFRYRARNYPETLNEEERQRWETFRRGRLDNAEARRRYQEELDEARERALPEQQSQLDELETWVAALTRQPETADS